MTKYLLLGRSLIFQSLIIFFGVMTAGVLTHLNAQNSANSITIKEKAGLTTNQYPIQIGRPFVQGEILNYPQVVIDGTPVLTQADVKNRWPDGSVKQAIISFLIPTLTANSSVTVSFTNQASGNNAGYLQKADLLNSAYDFDAAIQLENAGTTVSASARTMLSTDKFEYWLKGSVMTSVILSDHSSARSFDIGFDTNRSFRPIFHATFWPGINKVKVRYIGEISNTEALQDQIYSLALKLGNSAPQMVYSKPSVTHLSASRWTKEFWLGGAPPAIEINHNLAYLAKTKAIPNYDSSRVVPEAALAEAYSEPNTGWANAQKDLYDAGSIQKFMGSTGGRDEIGPYPTWTTRWLYSGDKRVEQQTFGNADLAAAFPVHFREGSSGRAFDSIGTNALGKVLSVYARPTVFLHTGNYYINFTYTDANDKLVPVGAMTDQGWVPDGAHQPDFYSPLYMLTGDYFYLEELLFWASWGAVHTNPSPELFYGRGPTSSSGGISGEIRAEAWLLRNRMHAALFAPDGSPEKSYFTRLTNDAIAIWEGIIGITGTPNYGSTNWIWGNTIGSQKYGAHGQTVAPALRFWEEGGTVPAWSVDIDPDQAINRTPPWQHYMIVFSLGRALELGYTSSALLSWKSEIVIGQLTNSTYDPFLIGAYQMPTIRKFDNTYFGVWPDERAAYFSSYNAQQDFTAQLTDANHGYPAIAMAATSMVANDPGGYLAWTFMQQNVSSATSFNGNPKWALLPRPPGPNPCSVTLGSNSITINNNETTGSFTVTNSSPDCPWSAFTNNSWVKITSTSAGLGNGTINYLIIQNFGIPRTGAITVNGKDFVINQGLNCTYTISLPATSIPATFSTGSVTVTASDAACAWTAVSNASWITVTSGATGSGIGAVGFSVAANATTTARTGTITIAGNTFTVNQAATCGYSLSATSASVGAAASTGTVGVIPSAQNCGWAAVSNASWITISSGASGTGNGTVGFSVGANTTATARTGTLTVAGNTFTVNQAAGSSCNYTLSATSVSVGATAGTGNLNVSTANNCTWTAVSNNNWITITSGANGSVNGKVNYSFTANSTSAPRTGTITVAGKTYTVTQAGYVCTWELSSNNNSVGATASTNSVNVITGNTCAWTAASNVTWITVTSGSNGTGNGAVTYSVAANTGNARTGTLTIAGKTLTVNQSKK